MTIMSQFSHDRGKIWLKFPTLFSVPDPVAGKSWSSLLLFEVTGCFSSLSSNNRNCSILFVAPNASDKNIISNGKKMEQLSRVTFNSAFTGETIIF